MPVPLATLRKVLESKAAPREQLRQLRQLVDQPPAPWPDQESGQGTLWVTVEGAEHPWPRAPYRVKRWWCIGCGKERVAQRWTRCRRCERRVQAGIPVDVDDCVTARSVCARTERRPKGRRHGG